MCGSAGAGSGGGVLAFVELTGDADAALCSVSFCGIGSDDVALVTEGDVTSLTDAADDACATLSSCDGSRALCDAGLQPTQGNAVEHQAAVMRSHDAALLGCRSATRWLVFIY